MNEDIDEAIEQVNHITDGELPEAPASANIKVWIDGYGVMFTTRGTQTKDMVDRVEYLVRVAKEKGWMPSWNTETNNKGANSAPANPNAPMCKIHNIPMEWKSGVSKKTGKSYAFWGCSQKNADGTYCQYKPEA